MAMIKEQEENDKSYRGHMISNDAGSIMMQYN